MKLLTLDVGGTEIKSALFDSDARILQRDTQPSNGREGAKALLQAIYAVAEKYSDYSGIGVACTGQVDAESGRIVYANRNVAGFSGTELGALLESRMGVPVTVDNDANAAALGEGAYGAARGARDYLCVTYGTGVGGAIVIDGKVYGGQSGVAGEIGHMLTHPGGRRCACGQRGCYEQYASVTALMRSVQRIAPEIRDGRELFAVMDERPALREAADRWIGEVAYGLVTLTHVLNPSLFVLCGGVMVQPYVLNRLKKVYAPQIMESYRPVALKKAELGNLAGAYGAFRRILEKVGKQEIAPE